jgi:peptidoglycan/xylan/chitin deacetylase (PgdA/CDA1 family)
MPFRVVPTAIIAGLLALSPVVGLMYWAPPPAIFWPAFMAWLGIVVYFSWIYLPDVDIPGGTLRRARPHARQRGWVAITFDDGPNGETTGELLDTLARHGARATFFCVGESAQKTPELIRRMVSEGHEVGNHTFSHRPLHWCSRTEIERQIAAAQDAIEQAGAPRPRLFRAPHGFKSPFLKGRLARHALRLVGWNVGVWDTDRPGADVIAGRVARRLRPGTILLLHDGERGVDRTQTVAAMEKILTDCRQRGLRPVTLSELLNQ